MRAVLINPPHSNPTGPNLGLPVLSAYIKANLLNVIPEIVDLSIESFYYLLSDEQLLHYRNILSSQIEELEACNNLVYGDLLILKRKHLARARIDRYRPEIHQTIRVLKDAELYKDYAMRERSFMEINALLDSIGAVFPNYIILSAGDYRSCYSPFSSSDIIEYIETDQNPYYDFFEKWIEQFDMRDVSFIGISISFAKQMLPALQLAKMIKEKYPSIFIQLGGSLMAHLKSDNFASILQYCDAIVQKEGEIPICRIIRKLQLGRKLDIDDGAVFMSNGHLSFPRDIREIDVSKETVPDFESIRFNDYLVPYPVVPLQIGRTCYWGKCTFCCLNAAFSHKNLWRTAQQIVNYIQEVVERFHVNTFEFVDDAIPPVLAGKISDLLLSKKFSIRWFSYARFDVGFTKSLLQKMKDAGCVGLKFGLESASPRVLKMMNKGINLVEAERIVKDTLAIGMHCQVAFFVGFPTETERDREITIDFLRNKVLPYGGVLSFNGWFRILKDMPIIQNEEFRDRILKWNTSEDLIDYFIFDTTTFDEMQKFALYLKNELFKEVKTDYVRSVDRRRYWFSGLCSTEDKVEVEKQSYSILSHYNLAAITEYRDKKFDDFRPGKGVYSTKSYISTNLLGNETLTFLNSSICQKRRNKQIKIILS